MSTLTAVLLTAGIALAGPARAADDYPSFDEVLYERPVNDALMPIGDVLDVVDPTGVEEQEGESEVVLPAGEDDVAEFETAPPAKKIKRPAKR
ncbi:MAG: hypothetical protein ACT4QF_04710 [Sporichthyaceae bacterium]